MKFDKVLVKKAAEELNLSEHQVLDIMEEIYTDAIWKDFNMDEIIEDATINFGMPILSLPEHREIVESIVKEARTKYRQHYNETRKL